MTALLFTATLNYTQFNYLELKFILKFQHRNMTGSSVFEAILSWINVDEKGRKHHFDDLVHYINFKGMPNDLGFYQGGIFKPKI